MAVLKAMLTELGGYFIRFDEGQRAEFLLEVASLNDGFSDALSRLEWPLREWNVCGLLFEPDLVTHWALARRGKKVATGKVRVEFIEVTPTRVPLPDLERLLGPQFRLRIVSARSGTGGRVPPVTWERMKDALGSLDPSSRHALERLERIRDQSDTPILRPGAEVVAHQRDAVGVALDAFDPTNRLRKRTLKAWAPPQGPSLTSFLAGLDVRTIEDQLIARDAAVFPGAEETGLHALGAVFAAGSRRLEVFNVNRSRVEEALGVDLIYLNDTFKAWTLVQYKMLESGNRTDSDIYRPDESFERELARMEAFRTELPDAWSVSDGAKAFRLSGDGFFFKFCSRTQLVVLSDALLPGMYLPREFGQAVLAGSSGPRGGRVISEDVADRHITNTLFAELLRDGWVGTRGASSERVADLLHGALAAGRALVIARCRPIGVAAAPEDTLTELGL